MKTALPLIKKSCPENICVRNTGESCKSKMESRNSGKIWIGNSCRSSIKLAWVLVQERTRLWAHRRLRFAAWLHLRKRHAIGIDTDLRISSVSGQKKKKIFDHHCKVDRENFKCFLIYIQIHISQWQCLWFWNLIQSGRRGKSRERGRRRGFAGRKKIKAGS